MLNFRSFWASILTIATAAIVVACNKQESPILYIGGIPDQDVSMIEARFNLLADYLSEETGLLVRYLPSISYAAVVTGFRNDDIQLAWYGGLTGVQARLAVPDARVLAQRPLDREFRSVFVANNKSSIDGLYDLKGKTLTFGSESSTSGYLMPTYFLLEAGINPGEDLKSTGFSGSHDATWKLVESGAFDAGVLNAAVWERRVAEGRVNKSRVNVFWTTPPYVDYHWVIRGDVDSRFGEGATDRIADALMKLNASNGGRNAEIMRAFQDEKFIPATEYNYAAIENVARSIGLIKD